MQPAKPSFLEYFEQKEKEANSHDGGGRGESNADNRKVPAEGDLQVVSDKHSVLYVRERVILGASLDQ